MTKEELVKIKEAICGEIERNSDELKSKKESMDDLSKIEANGILIGYAKAEGIILDFVIKELTKLLMKGDT